MKNSEFRCADHISKLDVREKASLIMVLTKIESGILLISSIYFRFFHVILPMLDMLEDHKDNEKLCDFTRKKFASILRTYIRTNESARKEQHGLYTLLEENYDFNLDPKKKQIESHVVVTLSDIDKCLDTLMRDILDMAQDCDIKEWNNNGRFDKISNTLKSLSTAIIYTMEDVSKALFDEDGANDTNNFIYYKQDIAKKDNNISSIMEMEKAINFNGLLINTLYKRICNLRFNMEMDIDIIHPVPMDDCEKPVKELYKDFGNMNDEAVKRDTHRNGLDLTYVNNNQDKKKKSKFPLFEVGYLRGLLKNPSDTPYDGPNLIQLDDGDSIDTETEE